MDVGIAAFASFCSGASSVACVVGVPWFEADEAVEGMVGTTDEAAGDPSVAGSLVDTIAGDAPMAVLVVVMRRVSDGSAVVSASADLAV